MKIVLDLTEPQARALVFALLVAAIPVWGTRMSRILARLSLKVSDAIVLAEKK